MDMFNAKAQQQTQSMDYDSAMVKEQDTHLHALLKHMVSRNSELSDIIGHLKKTRDRLNPTPMSDAKTIDSRPAPTEKDGLVSQMGFECERKDQLLDELREVIHDFQRCI